MRPILQAAFPVLILAIALSVGRSTSDFTTHALSRVDHATTAATQADDAGAATAHAVNESLDVLKGAAGGLRPQTEIEDEFDFIAGSSRPVAFNEIVLKNNYRLSMVATHHVNLDTKLQILSLHSLAHHGFREDVVTYYSQKVDQGDEQQIQSSIVIPRTIRVVDGRASITTADLESYVFRLENEPTSLASHFELREPLASPIRAEANAKSFNPLSTFIENQLSLSKIEDGQYEMAVNGMTYSVVVTPRLNEFGQLTLEISVREINSLVVTSYALIYEDETI